jgi:hypothetical protein
LQNCWFECLKVRCNGDGRMLKKNDSRVIVRKRTMKLLLFKFMMKIWSSNLPLHCFSLRKYHIVSDNFLYLNFLPFCLLLLLLPP